MKNHLGTSIKLSKIPIEEVFHFRSNPEYRDKFTIKINPHQKPGNGIQTRTIDSNDCEIIIEIAKGLSLGVAGNYLTDWVKYLFKKHNIKKLNIDGNEVRPDSSSSHTINQIIIQKIYINHREDDGEN